MEIKMNHVHCFFLCFLSTCVLFPLYTFLLPCLCSNLSNNRITDIEEGTFEGASGVNELILTSNRLENVHHRMLKGLGGLRTLWVHTHMHMHLTCQQYSNMPPHTEMLSAEYMSMHNSRVDKTICEFYLFFFL